MEERLKVAEKSAKGLDQGQKLPRSLLLRLCAFPPILPGLWAGWDLHPDVVRIRDLFLLPVPQGGKAPLG